MKSFFKANIAAIIASFCDFGITVFFKQVCKIDSVLASILGTMVGGLSNFLIGRIWVFRSIQTPFFHQGRKYLLTWFGNLVLNSAGVYVLIKMMGVHYLFAKIATAIIVAVGYNYPVQKKYVFKKVDKNEMD
jgi:putative flippase GtrA